MSSVGIVVAIVCWSVKGGSGTSVVAGALSLLYANRLSETGTDPEVLLVDLAGDAPAILGVSESQGPGISDWAAAEDVPPESIQIISRKIGEHLSLVDAGTRPLVESGAPSQIDGQRLTSALSAFPSCVVDAGSRPHPLTYELAASATHSLLVMRACYVALRRAVSAPVRPSGIVLISEPDRSLGVADVEQLLGSPVVARVPWDPAVARAVDAGTLSGRLPKRLAAALEAAT